MQNTKFPAARTAAISLTAGLCAGAVLATALSGHIATAAASAAAAALCLLLATKKRGGWNIPPRPPGRAKGGLWPD